MRDVDGGCSIGSGESSGESGSDGRRRTTRRAVLGAVGAGVVGAAGALPASAQSAAAATVSESGGSYLAAWRGRQIYSGGDLRAAIQAAVDSLSDGRTSKERVVVEASGTVSDSVYLPSFTTLDVRGTLTSPGDVTPIYADSVESISIPNLTVEGNVWMGVRIRRATDVSLGSIRMDLEGGIGIRIDDNHNDGAAQRTRNVTIEDVEVTGAGSHGVETYGVDGIDVGTVRTVDTGGCGLLLNDTSEATVGHVDATRANEGGGYAGFRCANGTGPNVTVERVDAVSCGRGVFTVSASHGITIREVHLEGNGGNLIQDTRDASIEGGRIVDTGGSGIRIDSRNDGRHPHTRNVTIENVTFEGNGGWGVRETGPGTEGNAIRNNDFCGNANGAVQRYADSTVVSGNGSDCSGDPDPCTPTSIDPYLRVDGGEWRDASEVTIDAGSQVEFGPHPTEGGSWSWSGPGASGGAREVTVSPDETATYTATYTSPCGTTSTAEYVVTVEGTGESGPTWPEGATDPDGDGDYEDLNGNGRIDYDDVVEYYRHRESQEMAENTEYYDYNDNGRIDYNDVVELYESR